MRACTQPVYYDIQDNEKELMRPAIVGTESVLSAALREPAVRRIVITSSCAAVLTPAPDPRTFSEENWNEASIVEVKEKGKDISKKRTCS